MSVSRLDLPDKSFDPVMTSFALEQSGEHLADIFGELRRVARKRIVLFEPTTQFFPTLPSVWNLPRFGWANRYYETLTGEGLPFAVRPNLLNHYHNPGTVFVIDLEGDRHPALRFPQLFPANLLEWPGGVDWSRFEGPIEGYWPS